MKRSILCIVFIILTAFGCSVVASKAPVGEESVTLVAKEWDGAWFNSEGAYCVLKVKDSGAGILQIGWIEGDSELKYQSGEVFIRKSGNRFFASMREDGEQNYVWAGIRKDGKAIIIWLPNEGRFRMLIEAKVLPGEVGKGTVILGNLNAEHTKIITSEDKGFLFDWAQPLVLMKLGD